MRAAGFPAHWQPFIINVANRTIQISIIFLTIVFQGHAVAEFTASVATSFPGQSHSNFPSAPAIFSFTTSQNPLYGKVHLDLKVLFLPSNTSGHAAVLDPSLVTSCHDLICEVSDLFPPPVNCYSGNFSDNITAERHFGIYFSDHQPLLGGTSYHFVVPGLRLLQGGNTSAGENKFRWLFEIRKKTGEVLESAVAALSSDVHYPSSTAYLTEFFVRGGQDMLPGSMRLLQFVFHVMAFPDAGQLLITFFPLLLWDQEGPLCAIQSGPFDASCEFTRPATHLGYNQMIIKPRGVMGITGSLSYYVRVVAPKSSGFLPIELSAAVLVKGRADSNETDGPYFEGTGSSTSPPPLELYTRFTPQAAVVNVGNRMESSTENPVTIRFRPGATLRGQSLTGEVRQLMLSITTSSFFIITSAGSVSGSAALGTDATPSLSFSRDQRSAIFSLGGRKSLILGNQEYSIIVFVTNPLRYFWAIMRHEPWVISIEQGPRLGCQGCPIVRYEGSFEGPPVDFAIRGFRVLLGSHLINTQTSVIFTFQLIYRTEQFDLMLPSGYVAQACSFYLPADLDAEMRMFLTCTPKSNGALLRVTKQPPGKPHDSLPTGRLLGFSSIVRNPTFASDTPGIWRANAVDGQSNVIAGIGSANAVSFELYKRKLPSFSVVTNDHNPNVTVVLTLTFNLSVGLQPGDTVQATLPADFRWKFTAAQFSAQPSGLDLLAALPVRIPSTDGTKRALSLQVVGFVNPAQLYGFKARVMHPESQPVDYDWHLATFGAGAGTIASQRYESASGEAYRLNLLSEVRLALWTYVGAAGGPVTINFKPTQAVGLQGLLIVRTPGGFTFSASCDVSELNLARNEGAPMTILAESTACSVITPNEVHVLFKSIGKNGNAGLLAGVEYSLTVHSLTNPRILDKDVISRTWRLETKDAQQLSLDSAAVNSNFYIGDNLPHGQLLLGGLSTGANRHAGALQWVTIIFQVFIPIRPQQDLDVFAAPGFSFDSFCSVRDPPAHSAPGALRAGSQLSSCRGLGAVAKLQVDAVWVLRQKYVFQIEVRNALPTTEAASETELPYLREWRLCLDGCRQMHTNLGVMPVQKVLQLGITTNSQVIGAQATLLVLFMLSTSMPPGGRVILAAPSGYIFPPSCNDLTSVAGDGRFPLPWGTQCRGGGFNVVRRLQGEASPLQQSELQLSLGLQEQNRLMAHKLYMFTVRVQNPRVDSQMQAVVWQLRTLNVGGGLIDFTNTPQGESATGSLVLPLLSFSFRSKSPYAGVTHSIQMVFRVLRANEGGNEDVLTYINRVEIRAPIEHTRLADRSSSQWDLSSPSACTTSFLAREGQVYTGLRHGNLTTSNGTAVCLVESPQLLSLTFRPSVISVDKYIELEFAIKNPQKGPESFWNKWRVNLMRLRADVPSDITLREISFLASQGALFSPLFQANLNGFSVIETLLSVQIQTSTYAVNETASVDFQLRPRSNLPRGSALIVGVPQGFTPQASQAFFKSNPRNPDLELYAVIAQLGQVVLLLSATHPRGEQIYFSLAVTNPPNATASPPLWEFELRASNTSDAPVLERTFNFIGYMVYSQIEVAGLFGSVRVIGSQYNFVRITFRLPGPLPTNGVVHVRAPPGFTLFSDGFDRENLPPFSAPVATEPGQPTDPSKFDVSVLYGLSANKFYAFKFGVENPTQAQQSSPPWELWCYSPEGTVISANRNVPAFELEAHFKVIEVLPSSVLPLTSTNLVEIQFVLDSTALQVIRSPTQHDRAFLNFNLPESYKLSLTIQQNNAASASFVPGCSLSLRSFSPAAAVTRDKNTVLRPLPDDSSCRLLSDRQLVIEVNKTLELGSSYRLALEVENPLVASQANMWRVSTQRNGGLLHIDNSVSNFAMSIAQGFDLASTDAREQAVQLLHVSITPPRHVRGGSGINLKAPSGFTLLCQNQGQNPPSGNIPSNTSCLLQGDDLRMRLPPSLAYAPYEPMLLANETYHFAVFCQNPNETVPSLSRFEIQLMEDWPKLAQVININPEIRAPALAPDLDFFVISPVDVGTAGEPTDVTVRFQAPQAPTTTANVQAILLEGPQGVQLSTGVSGPCTGFHSIANDQLDNVLPAGMCSGVARNSVVIQFDEPLPLVKQDGGGLPYIFSLTTLNPKEHVLVDVFSLSLLPGPGSKPLFTASTSGFTGRVLGLQPLQLPGLPEQYRVPAPLDMTAPPLSTVQAVVSGMFVRAQRLSYASAILLALCT